MLRAYRERRWDLDVVERAEAVVRNLRQQQLTQALENTQARLDAVTQAVNDAHRGSNVVAMLEAEQRLCTAQHMAQKLLRRHLEESRAAEEVHAAYSAHRREVTERINPIEIMLARQRITGL
jgi:hypothetical protein